MLRWKFDVYAALEQRGITFHYMATKYNNALSQQTMANIKNGDTKVTYKTINALCWLLDCQPGDLLEYVDEK